MIPVWKESYSIISILVASCRASGTDWSIKSRWNCLSSLFLEQIQCIYFHIVAAYIRVQAQPSGSTAAPQFSERLPPLAPQSGTTDKKERLFRCLQIIILIVVKRHGINICWLEESLEQKYIFIFHNLCSLSQNTISTNADCKILWSKWEITLHWV